MKKHPLLFNYILFVKTAYIFISIIILSLVVLTGCPLRISAREEAEDIVATVIKYINKGDSEGLIALFCEEVKENYELTADVDILFNMFDGEITSYEVSAVAYVDDKEYRIEVSKTIYDNQDPQRVGLTTVMAKDVNVKGMFFVGEVNVFYG